MWRFVFPPFFHSHSSQLIAVWERGRLCPRTGLKVIPERTQTNQDDDEIDAVCPRIAFSRVFCACPGTRTWKRTICDTHTNILWRLSGTIRDLGGFFFCHCCPLTFGLIEKLEGHPRYLFFEVALRFRNPSGVIRTSPPPHSVEVPSYWFPHQQRLEKFICVRRRGRHKSWAWGLFPSKKWKKNGAPFFFLSCVQWIFICLITLAQGSILRAPERPSFCGFLDALWAWWNLVRKRGVQKGRFWWRLPNRLYLRAFR